MKTNEPRLKSPFTGVGGKGRIARQVWELIGNVGNAIEPFCLTAAWMLARPHKPEPWHRETINDVNHWVANFWRAVKIDPDGVAYHACAPVSEVEMAARHNFLMRGVSSQVFRSRMLHDPEYCDPKIAGYWVYGQTLMIGGANWCNLENLDKDDWTPGEVRPQLADAFSRARGLYSGDEVMTVADRREYATVYCRKLADRLNCTRVLCGDWSRAIESDSVTLRIAGKEGHVGVMHDPPYGGETGRSKRLYAAENLTVAEAVRKWCITPMKKSGLAPDEDERFRIVLCGLEGEHNELEDRDWRKYSWTGSGYGNNSDEGKGRAAQERYWASPHCLAPESERRPLIEAIDAASREE